MRRIGLLGGSFDPVHLGHLAVAIEVWQRLNLDEVWLMPAKQSPGKIAATSDQHRLAMLMAACAIHPALRICSLELELPAPSYTYRTLETLIPKYPDCEFCLILGADAFLSLESWKNPQRIANLVHLVVVNRIGSALALESREVAHPCALVHKILHYNEEQVCMSDGIHFVRGASALHVPTFEIASRDIRARIAAGQTVCHLVPKGVDDYLRHASLYCSTSTHYG